MVKIKHIKGKDKSEENWRLSVTFEPQNHVIIIKTENFTHGFRDGEDWDHIAKFPSHYTSGVYDNYVTYITKRPEKMDKVLGDMITMLHEIITCNIKASEKEIAQRQNSINLLKDGLNSALFRDKKIDVILNDV
jgi:hypothetical protein